MDIQLLVRLLNKFRQKRCSDEEMEQLNQWYDSFEVQVDEIPAVPVGKLEALLKNINARIDRSKVAKRRRVTLRLLSGIAASVMLVLGGTLFFRTDDSVVVSPEQVIKPGQQFARLQLSDGRVVDLDSCAVVHEIDGSVLKNDTVCVLDYSRLKTDPGQILYNTIRVPLGGEYNLRLSDGTRVWMNSGSCLKFPVTFQGERREVVLEGEGYFEVTPSTKPFIVMTSDMDIKVLGTSFNVSAYRDDQVMTTTLVTGSVEVSEHHQRQKYRIIPGHTLTYRKSTSEVTVGESDTDLYTSWIKGEFKFRNMRLEEIMMKLNRWYNCEISYEHPELKELRFSGAAEKDRPIDYLLEMIETITEVRFRIEGNQIRVMHK